MEVDRQPGCSGKRITEEWKQTGSQATQAKVYAGNGSRQAAKPARQKAKQGMEADTASPARERISREWKQTNSQASRANR